MRDGGKGDSPRPIAVPLQQFDNNWDAIFKSKLAKQSELEAKLEEMLREGEVIKKDEE